LDTIFIEGLEVLAHVGITQEERRQKQRLRIDLELSLLLARAGESDSVEDTIDYAAVSSQVKKTVEDRPFVLVEALAEAVAQAILKRFRPKEVRVRVKKFSVPETESVGVEILRRAGTKQPVRSGDERGVSNLF